MQLLYLPSGEYEDCVQCLEIDVKSMGVLQPMSDQSLYRLVGKELALYEYRMCVSSVHHSCAHTTGTKTPSSQPSEGHEGHTFLQRTEYFTNTASLHRVGII